jgi:hypothetical protein
MEIKINGGLQKKAGGSFTGETCIWQESKEQTAGGNVISIEFSARKAPANLKQEQ